MNYFKLLKNITRSFGSKDFLIIDDDKYTYEKIYEDSVIISDFIQNNIEGLNTYKNKKTILILSKDIYFQLVLFFAANRIGLIPIIIHSGISNEVLNEIMELNKISMLLSDDNQDIKESNLIQSDTLKNKLNIYIRKDTKNNMLLNSEICMGVFTSGSTGIPKVLYRTYTSWAGFFSTQNKIFKINSESKIFINGEVSFTGNLNVIMSVLYEGATIVINRTLNPTKWVDSIEKHNVSNIYVIPTKLKLLCKKLNKNIKNIRTVFTGSQLLSEEIGEKLKKYFNNCEIILYYGASELNYISYINYEEIKQKPLSVGKPFPQVDVFIKDEYIYINTDYHVENIKCPCTVYDKGYIDKDGHLIFQGRKDDVINCGGVKISLYKIEYNLKSINGIEDAVVISLDNDIRGKDICVFIVPKGKISRKYIIDELKKRIIDIEIPRKIVFLKHIPLNNIGKIDMKELKRRI